jgi:hypothetical protein
LVKKWANNLNRHFTKNDIKMVDSYMKRYSTRLIIREIEYLLSKRQEIVNLGQGCRENGIVVHCYWGM